MHETSTTSALHELAERYGILPEYIDQSGRDRRQTSDETRIALLRAMGVDATTDEVAARTLDEAHRARAARLLPAARVAVSSAQPLEARVALPAEWGDSVGWALELQQENGAVRREGGVAQRRAGGSALIPIPGPLETGYHRLHIELHGQRETRTAEQLLIVAPPACPAPGSVIEGGRAYGITVNLYTVRSERNWGVGDITDLERLVRWAGEIGAAFVGVNPLHALRNSDADISPYSPLSRLFRNPLYLDVEAVPELERSRDARAFLESEETRDALKQLRATNAVDYEGVMTLKHRGLRLLHASFVDGGESSGSDRRRAYDEYVVTQGQALEDFATFMALEEWMRGEQPDAWHWQAWPGRYQDPRSHAVAKFRAEHARDVDYHRWLQFELDRQLGVAADAARDAGLAIGLYQDLAIGAAPSGSDTWSFGHLFAEGVSIGAPPDIIQKAGQNWGLPPIDPHRLVDDAYGYWIRIVRSTLRHAGALRIDHVLGLFRQFWIPEGKTGSDGAYVRFPAEDLLGILALESTRHGALVVGEDLGTVPEEVPPTLERWKVLSSKVLYFERDEDGAFHPASRYAAHSLATANTHDLPTLAGFWTGRDIELKRDLGLAESEDEIVSGERDRAAERAALLRRLSAAGLIGGGEMPDAATLRGAVHDFLLSSPAALVGIALADAVGERDPVNMPGVPSDKYRSWTRRLRTTLEELTTSEDVRRSLGARVRARTRGKIGG